MAGKKATEKASNLSKETVSDSSGDEQESPASSTSTSPSDNKRPVQKSGKATAPPSTSKPSSAPNKGKKASTVVSSLPAKPYKAPSGFSKVTDSRSSASSEATELLSDIGNKQIWHITAPASLPISSLKGLAMSSVDTGKPIASQKGHSYGISKIRKSAPETEAVFLPAGSDGMYEHYDLSFRETYQIYEISSEANDETTTEAPTIPFPAVEPGKYARPVRQQPSGLRTRYQPFGIEGPVTGKSDDSSFSKRKEDGFRAPRQLPSPPIESPKKKRKRHDAIPSGKNDPDSMDIDTKDGETVSVSQPSTALQVESPVKGKTKKEKKEKKDKKEEKEKKPKKKKKDKEASQEA